MPSTALFRFSVTIALLLGAWPASGETLAVIRPDRAGPEVDIHTSLHGEWVLWPYRRTGSDPADLWTATTGITWAPSTNPPPGLDSAMTRWLPGIGTKVDDKVGDIIRRLGSKSGSVVIRVTEVDSWDSVSVLARQGRVLVLEYPPRPGQNWSRYWLFGPDWPRGLPGDGRIRGLVLARDVLRLAGRPESFVWQENDTSAWGGANRWLEHVNFGGPLILFILSLTAVYATGCSLYCLLLEQRGPLAALLLRAAMLGPFALLGSTWLNLFAGISNWPLHFCLSWAVLVLLTQTGFLWKQAPSLRVTTTICATIAMATPLAWSFLSPVYSQVQARSGAVWLGLVLASTLAAWVFSGSRIARILVALGVASAMWQGIALFPATAALPLVLIVASRPWPRAAWVGFALGSVGLAVGLNPRGTSFSGDGLTKYSDLGTLNLLEYLQFFAGPGFIALIGLGVSVLLLRDRYLLARLRRMLKERPERLALFRGAGGLLVAALAEPVLINSAMVALTAAICVYLHDAVLTG